MLFSHRCVVVVASTCVCYTLENRVTVVCYIGSCVSCMDVVHNHVQLYIFI